MTFRRLVVSAAAAAALTTTGALSAQVTTSRTQDSTMRRVTSQQRIPVQKESNGTFDARADSIAMAERARRDSVAQALQRQRDSLAAVVRARTDSVARLEQMRRDSLAVVEAARRDSIARVDSIANAEQMRQQRIRDRFLFDGSGWYIGLSGGGALPTGDFEDLGYQSGYDINVPLGWHSPNRLLGVRMDFGFSAFDSREFVGSGANGNSITLIGGSPKVYSAALNATARVPVNSSRSVNLYAVGGGGLYHFRSFGRNSAIAGFLGNDVLESNENQLRDTRTKFGAQVGGGIDFGVGPASIFVESRFVNVFADRSDNVRFESVFGERTQHVRWIPIVLGVNIR